MRCRALRLALIAHLCSSLVSAAELSFLSEPLVRTGQVQSVLDYDPPKDVTCEEPNPEGPIETTLCDYESVDTVNEELYSNLSELVRMPFFKYFQVISDAIVFPTYQFKHIFQVDLYRECPFWPDDGSCNDIGCAITTVDESDVPIQWRASTLSKVDENTTDKLHRLPGCYYRDSDFCFLDDNSEGDYFDLTLVPERFTGYSGPHAQRIWHAIYEENCFGLAEYNLMSAKSPAPVSLPDTLSEVLMSDEEDHNTHCIEKRVYYKIISGLHASISTHICRDYLDQTSGEWKPNLQCFINRVASHPERLQYIYFNTVILLRAVARLRPYLSAYDYCSSGNHEDDAETWQRLSKVLTIAHDVGRFDETVLFRGDNANILKEEFKTHFRNVSQIMDCIGCDKCRLWGKVQTTGLATAMKVLFEMDDKALNPRSNSNLLQRSEVVALFNTLYRMSESLEYVNDFRRMWSKTSLAESEKLVEEAEKSVGHSVAATSDSETAAGNMSKEVRDTQSRFAFLVQKCKERTALCIDLVMNVMERGASVLSSAFKITDREEL
ncbi:hypothetical protein AMATHDRAFT_1031 [Amanita thiersii Skay4041]|uniref:Endoplasmic oxidoreductin n=1 Tax=Amanita thiersii Skay4041 TaxID=703135 RepID=A0A2A9NS34_9AGAR|nr:hypothetical protein AMATHDRAFT_1031 [Amanita thiersii Skay4041]